MRFDDTISNLVASQFPEFYAQEGPAFIAFVKAYYEFLDKERVTRNLLDVSDSDGVVGNIGNSIDLFADSFKNQYLLNFPNTTSVDKSFLVKHIQDFYKSKGSIASIKLLFQLLFGIDSDVYVPGNDIIRASDGKWVQPYYLEVNKTSNINSYLGTKITGSTSGATAWVESIARSRTNGKFVDVLYLSHLVGNFQTGEFISNNGNYQFAPQVSGSLTTISIIDGGANNAVGDTFTVSGAYGALGKARVLKTAPGFGKVSFNIIDGGTGYEASTPLTVASKTLGFINATGPFPNQETLTQSLYQINFSAVSGNTFAIGQNAYAYSASANVVGFGYIVNTPNSTSITISPTSGTFANIASVKTFANTSTGAFSNLVNVTATGTIIGSNSSYLGMTATNNNFYVGASFSTSGGISNVVSTGNCSFVSTGSGANASVGTLSNIEVVNVYTDALSDFNAANVQLSSLRLNGSNSGLFTNTGSGTLTCNTTSTTVSGTGTTFSTSLTGNVVNLYIANTYIGTVNNISSNTTLTLVSNAAVNASTNTFSYNFGQFGIVNNSTGNENTTLNALLNHSLVNIGTIASLSNINPGSNYNVNPIVAPINAHTASFNKHDYIINIKNISGNLFPGVTINQIYTSNGVVVGTATAMVKSANTTQVIAKRTSFAYSISNQLPVFFFNNSQNIGSANVVSVYADTTSLVMGRNANITGLAKNSSGIAASVVIIDSGINYVDNEQVILTSNTNPLPISGIAHVNTQGTGVGYWSDNSGKLNSTQFIHDNDYYQEFSYEVQSEISFDRYVSILKNLVHITGMKMFGKVIIENTGSNDLEAVCEVGNQTLQPLLLNGLPFLLNNNVIYL